MDLCPIPEYFRTYTVLVGEDDALTALENQTPEELTLLQSLDDAKAAYRYAPGKWSVKEVLQHIIDSERVFTYRAMALARTENAVLPGFDQDQYNEHAHANDRKWTDMVQEYAALRQATIGLIKSLHAADLSKTGKVSDYVISVVAILYTIAGHARHHIRILRERYLQSDSVVM